MKTYSGGCLCGNIRFQAIGENLKPHTCSCTMCQKNTGALTVCWLEFEKNQVTWDEGRELPSLFQSSKNTSRAFCSLCGSTLGAIDKKGSTGLLLGCFDEKSSIELRPIKHSYQAMKEKWWHIKIDLN